MVRWKFWDSYISGLESMFTDFSTMPFHLHTDKRDISNMKAALPWIHRLFRSTAMPLYLVRNAQFLCRKKAVLSAWLSHLPVLLRCSEVYMSLGNCRLYQIMQEYLSGSCSAHLCLWHSSISIFSVLFLILPSAATVPFIYTHPASSTLAAYIFPSGIYSSRISKAWQPFQLPPFWKSPLKFLLILVSPLPDLQMNLYSYTPKMLSWKEPWRTFRISSLWEQQLAQPVSEMGGKHPTPSRASSKLS